MPAPTYSDVLAFSNAVGRVSDTARRAFEKRVGEVDFYDWSLAAQELRAIIEEIVTEYGLAASELGAQWYEYCRLFVTPGSYTAQLEEVNRDALMHDVNEEIDKLFAGSVTEGKLVESLSNVVTYSTYDQARSTVTSNLETERRSSLSRGNKSFADKCGYARVTTGSSCAFCVLLASRGFAYASEKSATKTKTGDSYHPNCRCVAVPFHNAHDISGYGEILKDHEAKYDQADEMRVSGNMPDELKERIADAKAHHDGRWSSLNETLVIMRYQNEGMH